MLPVVSLVDICMICVCKYLRLCENLLLKLHSESNDLPRLRCHFLIFISVLYSILESEDTRIEFHLLDWFFLISVKARSKGLYPR